jgi:hypothetical protein
MGEGEESWDGWDEGGEREVDSGRKGKWRRLLCAALGWLLR